MKIKESGMKKILIIGLMFISIGCAKDLNPELLMKKIETSNPDQLKTIIETGHNDSELLDSYSLILLSMASLKNTDSLGAELFLYKALLRAGVDRDVYVPTDTGGNSPLLALMALRQQITFALSEGANKSPKQYQYLIDSLKNWQPICDDSYNPGWDYEVTPDLQLCQSKFKELIDKNIDSMLQRKVLYEHPEYFTLLKKWQDLKMKSVFSQSKVPDKELITLQNKLIDIENELGVKGEVTKQLLISSLKTIASELIGEWRLYKDDDYPNKEKYNEILNFRSDGQFCIEATTIFGGEYDLKLNSLTILVSLFGNSIAQKREYKLKNDELKLKNKKNGWAYYKKLNETPNESCYISLKLTNRK